MKKKTVALIFGAYSSEYPVSLKSAHNVLTHMNYDKYDVICIGITDEGKWLRYNGDIDKIFNDEWRKNEKDCVPVVLLPDRHAGGFLEFREEGNVLTKVDVLFPMIHGRTGEDGCLQGLFELTGIPYVGCGVLPSAICMDKDIAHRLARTVGIRTTKSVIGYAGEPVEEIKKRAERMKYPLFIKPSCAGSSYGVSEVKDESEFAPAVELAAKYGNKIKIEEKVVGIEVGASVLGTGQDLIVGEVDEIVLEYGFLNTHLQATPEKGSVNSSLRMPAELPEDYQARMKEKGITIEELRERIKQTAIDMYRVSECKGCARVDMFVTEDLEIYLNEVNTMPGFTTYSRYPLMMQGGGMEIEELLEYMIEDASTVLE